MKSRMDTKGLIRSVHKRELLWNSRHHDYRNRSRSYEAWKQVALEMSASVEDVKRKWKGLRDTFNRELRKLPRGQLNDFSFTPEQHPSSWVHFKDLLFMRDQFAGQKSMDIACKLENTVGVDNTEMATRPEGEDTRSFEDLKTFEDFSFSDSSQTSTVDSEQVLPSSRTRQWKFDRKVLELEKRKLSLMEKYSALEEEGKDEDRMFLLSLLSEIKKLPSQRKFFLRLKIQELVYSFVYPESEEGCFL